MCQRPRTLLVMIFEKESETNCLIILAAGEF
jgi:hypothetical protein